MGLTCSCVQTCTSLYLADWRRKCVWDMAYSTRDAVEDSDGPLHTIRIVFSREFWQGVNVVCQSTVTRIWHWFKHLSACGFESTLEMLEHSVLRDLEHSVLVNSRSYDFLPCVFTQRSNGCNYWITSHRFHSVILHCFSLPIFVKWIPNE